MLQVRNLETSYGRSQVLFGVSFDIGKGEVATLLGRNGMGKTTTVRSIMGISRAGAGTISYQGREIQHLPSYRIAQAGIGLVPEGRQVFPSLPVEANLLLGAFGRSFRVEIATSTIRYLRRRAAASERLERVYTLLPKLHELRDRPAGRTSGGEQQMVAIGRALMAEPRALAIDELSLGLAPMIVEQLVEFLHRLNDEEHVAILLVEQNALLAFDLCERAYVLETGHVVLEGESSQIRDRPEVHSAYLGGGPG